MSKSRWSPYRPSPEAPWNLARAWTLGRRAGFAATWAELRRDLDDGHDAALNRVLEGTCRLDGRIADFAATADLLGDAAGGTGDTSFSGPGVAHRLQAWWLYRMLFTPDPLTERLTLLWHNHFATSQLKVEDVAAMKRQNDTFRRHARGPFGDLLRAMLSDPALLAWLDASSNRKGKPNENLAREMMELFTLGIGHYTERDVKEAARALTGRTVQQGRYTFRPDWHDDEAKTILGRTGRLDGDTLADRLLEHPATAHRLAWRLCQAFLGENGADESAVAELAGQLHSDSLHIGRGVETILRSERFFAARNLHAQVSEPAPFVIGTVRSLERFNPPPSTLLLAEWTGRMGQELFYPPNVGGWPGGRNWLAGRTILARANFAAALVEGRLNAASTANAPDLLGLAARHGRGTDAATALRFSAELLLGRPIDAATCQAILRKSDSTADSEPNRFNRAVALLLSRPEAQLS
ncbi:MAG TPA: DUF1800 domain-containing protein [Isosphaeraceae bacterium]|nr:DUF1800 domain-containing protein [Isosphaeraceae bacterium]